jgi:hypothetical protein
MDGYLLISTDTSISANYPFSGYLRGYRADTDITLSASMDIH